VALLTAAGTARAGRKIKAPARALTVRHAVSFGKAGQPT
jgi:hypothetical protein